MFIILRYNNNDRSKTAAHYASRSPVILTSPVLGSEHLNSATTITDGTQSSPQLIVTFEQHLLTRYSKILIKFALRRDPTGNVAKATCTCFEIPPPYPGETAPGGSTRVACSYINSRAKLSTVRCGCLHESDLIEFA